MFRALIPAASVAAVVALAGCPTSTKKQVVDPGPVVNNCTQSADCPAGHICSGGSCQAGVCDVALESACRDHSVGDTDQGYCCKPWEKCNAVTFNCENDPSVHGIGCDPNDPSCTPCETQDDCAAGQFCSGAACYDAAGRQSCQSTFQCGRGQRCDRNVFLCVPDQGGCNFCGPDFPELCCEAGQTCSQQSGFCVDVGEAQCTTPGSIQECADAGIPGTKCDDQGRCVQCTENADCGPGLECDTGTGDCFPPQARCSSDDDCSGDLRCATAIQECVNPTCTSDADCAIGSDHRRTCALDSFTCVLPDPVCTETDEPNNDSATAAQITDLASGYAGTLCRNDFDFIAFPVVANKSYDVTVDFGGSGQPGISVQLLNTEQHIESSTLFAQNDSFVVVSGTTGASESGLFYVRIQGSNQDHDQWSYSISINERDPSPPADCSAAGQPEEPNDDFAHATPLTIGTTRTFSRCSTSDVDFYQVPVSRLHGAQITLAGFVPNEGDLDISVFSSTTGSPVVTRSGPNPIEQFTVPEGVDVYYIKVFLRNANSALDTQTYTLRVDEVPRPPQCTPDPTEDDGLLASASVLTLVPDAQGNPGYVLDDGVAPDGSTDATVVGPLRCNPQDVDMFRFTMPPNLGGTVQLRFNQSEGDMKLILLDADGNQVTTSNVSTTANPVEQVSVPGSPTDSIDYIAQVQLASSTGGILGEHYRLEIRTFDNAQCIASEPSGGDDSFQDGRCIGDPYTPIAGDVCVNASSPQAEPLVAPDLATCTGAQPGAVPGCGLICGNSDSDYYRLGVLNNEQVLHAHLEYDPTQGVLALARGIMNSNGTLGSETSVSDSTTNPTGHVDLTFVTPNNSPKEYAVRVKTVGATGHQVEPYALSVEVGPECHDDQFDVGAASNEKPSLATVIRPNPTFGAAFNFDSSQADALPGYTPPLTHCTTTANSAGDIDVYELFAFAGEHVTLTLTQLDNSPTGLQAELGTRPANLDNPAVAFDPPLIATSGAPVTFDNPVTQQLYITVRVPAGVTVTGPYTLAVSTTSN